MYEGEWLLDKRNGKGLLKLGSLVMMLMFEDFVMGIIMYALSLFIYDFINVSFLQCICIVFTCGSTNTTLVCLF